MGRVDDRGLLLGLHGGGGAVWGGGGGVHGGGGAVRGGVFGTLLGGSLGGRGSLGAGLGALVGDAELGRVLEVAGGILDQLQAVVGHVILQAGARGPRVMARVLDALDDGLQRQDVRARPTEQDQRHGAFRGWLESSISLCCTARQPEAEGHPRPR